ncbi:MAG TPA: ornithine carbamoyltransferase [Phycisphaerae bacterium]|nr:ornithine carbamoyltransferase [Phycisphaerae bacterium]
MNQNNAPAAKRDFLDILNHPRQELEHMLQVAARLKQQYKTTGRNEPLAAGKTLAMIFEKPSLRTRVSFDAAMTHLGGSAIYISPAEIGIGSRESAPDVARVLAGLCDAIMARTFSHKTIEQLAQYCSRPVINGLSDKSHPCQAMADFLTISEHFGGLSGRCLAYIGDGNNVARSLLEGCTVLGLKFRIASPSGYQLDDASIAACRKVGAIDFQSFIDPKEAVKDADVIYTDTWVSMGQEDQKVQRLPVFAPYQINDALLAAAPSHAMVMHCLPAYRGVEITDSVMDSPRSIVFQQAENRLHFQKGLLAILIGGQ